MRRSPQSFPPLLEALSSLMSLPPQAVRPRPAIAARATSRVRRSRRAISVFPSSPPRRSRRKSVPVASGGVPRDPVEHHAERGDGHAGAEPLAEQLVLAEARDDDVAEAPAA